jgi:regulator of protease activity HflC (stomatin/prohibitin superfamily)
VNDAREDLKEIGPWGQSVALAFRFLFGAVCLIAAGWFFSNFRQVPADSQAVVMRFGSLARSHGPGLLIAWPRPIERVTLLPASARQIPLKIENFELGQASEGFVAEQGYDLSRDPRLNGGFLLAGDSNVVHLSAQLYYQISDPVAYMVEEDHARPALQRLFIAGAVSVVARRDLDSILVARPEVAARTEEAAARERFRTDLMAEVNKRLAALAQAGSGLGITVSRVDLVPSIPAGAKAGFDNVLVVTQNAETTVANARTTAQGTTESANSKKDKIATSATATAEEIVTNAKTQTASIAALGQQQKDMSRSMLMTRYFYTRIEPILKKAGGVDLLDNAGVVRTILPGVYATPNRRTNQ